MKFYVVRHGQTSWNTLGINQGWSDIEQSTCRLPGLKKLARAKTFVSILPIPHHYSEPPKPVKLSSVINSGQVNFSDLSLEEIPLS